MATVKMIDVSKHNVITDWQKVKQAGIDAVIIRAGYGRTTDPKFSANITGAKAAGLAVGVYWFAYPLSAAGAKKEADYAKSVLSQYKLDLGVYYDYEYDSDRYATQNDVDVTNDFRTDCIKAFCDRMKGYGYKVGVYLNPDYIQYKVKYNELKSYPLWLAQWAKSTGATYKAINANSVNTKWGKPEIWQIGAGKINGISGNVDMNYYYGDMPGIDSTVQNKKQYFAKANYNGVSLVEGLISVGASYSFVYRKKIASANGIYNYTGIAAQNTKLLGLLKSGKLIKP